MHFLKHSWRVVAVVGLLVLPGHSAWSPTIEAQVADTTGVTMFEGARLIVGDGRPPIEKAAFVVSGNRIIEVGTAGSVRAPAGAVRVNLAGKTVMPAIVDTHTHLSQTRDLLMVDLRRRAYYGVGAALSLGQDTTDMSFEVRAQTTPGAARFFTAGRGITSPEPGRTTAPYWVTTPAEARKAVQDVAVKKVDVVKIWVDDRNATVKKLSPELYAAVIDEATRTDSASSRMSSRSTTRKD